MQSRLMRSRNDRMLGGVCGGLAAYLRIDATIIRLLFVLMALGSGAGVFIYLVLWFVLPAEGASGSTNLDASIRVGAEEMAERARTLGADLRSPDPGTNRRGLMIVGAGLVLVGAIVFLNNLNIPWLAWLKVDLLWPLVLVAAGVLVEKAAMLGTDGTGFEVMMNIVLPYFQFMSAGCCLGIMDMRKIQDILFIIHVP